MLCSCLLLLGLHELGEGAGGEDLSAFPTRGHRLAVGLEQVERLAGLFCKRSLRMGIEMTTTTYERGMAWPAIVLPRTPRS